MDSTEKKVIQEDLIIVRCALNKRKSTAGSAVINTPVSASTQGKQIHGHCIICLESAHISSSL